ncbi:MAG: ABC transporter substrate-binding protein [Bacillota bacterium]|nr:ABC transporter substrate-binding protein [Bacillota bacterium]
MLHPSHIKTMSTRRRLVALVAATLLLGACAPVARPTESPTTTAPATDPATDPAAAKTAAPDPTTGGIVPGSEVVVAVTQEPDFLDPYLAEAAGTKEILYNLFDGLVRLEPDGSLSPALAVSWEMSDDAMAYSFVIREGVKFHNGAAMTLDDVVYSLERAAGLGAEDATALVPQLGAIASVTADAAKYSVTTTLKAPDPDLLAFFTTAILPRGYEKQAEHPIGTGPYRFVSYETQQRILLRANPDYFVPGRPSIESVEFRIVPNADSAMVDLEAGRIDVFPYLTPDSAKQVEDRFQLIESRSNMVHLLALNNARPPLDQRDVREALRLAIDKPGILDLVTGGYGSPITSGMSPAMGAAWNADIRDGDAAPDPAGDPDRARELLAAAGYPDGFELTISVPSNYVIHVRTAEVIAEQLREVGIIAKIEPVDWATWLSRIYSDRDFQATVIALTFVYSPVDVLDRYRSDAANNFINFSSADFDRRFADLGTTLDAAGRQRIWHDLQQILFDEAASVFIQDPALLTAVARDLGGYTVYPQYVQDIASLHPVGTDGDS